MKKLDISDLMKDMEKIFPDSDPQILQKTKILKQVLNKYADPLTKNLSKEAEDKIEKTMDNMDNSYTNKNNTQEKKKVVTPPTKDNVSKETDQEIGDKNADKRDIYYVDRILDHFYCRKTRTYFYLILWEGLPRSQSSWEPENNIPQICIDNYNSSKNEPNKASS